MRPISKIAPTWWDFTTLDSDLLNDAARLTAQDLLSLARPGFDIRIFDTNEEFYLAEALEYIDAWKRSTADDPAGICGPVGPTEQLPLVARLVNDMELDVREGHFWGMDEWVDQEGWPVPESHPLSFARANMELCFHRIKPKLRMPDSHIRFPSGDLIEYSRSFDRIRCVVMQGGQGEVKHWAFNDPPQRLHPYQDAPPDPETYRQLGARVTDLHPMTIIQNARTSGSGHVAQVPAKAATVGPVETWKSERVSIWHGGQHDNRFGIRLTTLMISQGIVDTSVPMSLLADHPHVTFNFIRNAIGSVEATMH